MSTNASITGQLKHYLVVFSWMTKSYYQQEKKSFWLIQLLMGLSVVLGLAWVLGLVAGLNNLNDPNYLKQFGSEILQGFYSQPFFMWLSQISVAGMIGVFLMYQSYQIGVHSIIRFQVRVLRNVLKTVNQTDEVDWLAAVADEPRKKTHRIIKVSVQLTGLVVRRLVRMLVPMLTFLVAFFALLKLDAELLLYLIPFALIYLVLLYFINRSAARNQVKLTTVSESSNKKMSGVIDDMLFQNKSYDNDTVEEIEATDYRFFSLLRYRRRLAEIHVVWVNSLFLILGSALIVIAYSSFGQAATIDWLHLILFLVALRYAGSGLQEMASATVAFSRFLPDTELVYQLLNPIEKGCQEDPIEEGVVFYFNSNIETSSMLPQLLKLNHGVKQCYELNEKSSQLITSQEHEVIWIYSVKPLLFKQSVKKFQSQISKVLLYENGYLRCYDDVAKFLTEFNPEQHQMKRSNFEVDEDDLY